MKKILAALLLLVPTCAFSTTTVTGNIKDLTGTAQTNTFVRFWLRGCNGNQPRVSGVGVIAPSQGGVFYFDAVPNGSGAISKVLYATTGSGGTGDGEIECGGSKQAVWYGMQVYNNGKPGPEIPIAAPNTGTVDISSVSPISVTPVVAAPTGDTTYIRLDGGNAASASPILWSSAQTYNAQITFKSTTAGYEVWTGDFLVSNLFNIVLNPSVNSSANQFGLQSQMYDLTANTKTYSGQQQAVYGSYSHMGSGSANGIFGGAFEGFNAGSGTTTVVYGASGNAYCGGVAIAVESGTPQQNPANNGNCTNLRGMAGSAFNLSSGTVGSAAALYAGSATNSNGGTITNLYGVQIADQTLGTNNWAIKTGLGLVQFGDNLRLDKLFGMGAAANASAGMFIQPSTMTGTTQFGVRALPTTSSAATTQGIGVYGRADTAAAAYTQTENDSLYAANPTKGAGSTITTAVGVKVESITVGSTNKAIWTLGSAVSEFDGGIQAGASGSTISDTRELLQSVHSCGTTTTCANTANGSYREVFGTVTLSTGAATLSSITAFTSTSSFGCTCTDQTAANACKAVPASITSVTFAGTGSDVLFYRCVGN